MVFSDNLSSYPYVMTWFDGVKNYTGNGTIAEFTFKVNANAKAGTYPITISCNADDIVDLNEKAVAFGLQNGGVIVSSHLPGDVNDDGKVNVKDLIRLQQYIAGWNVTVRSDAIDINGDGKINVKDLIRLQQYIAGWNVVIY